MDKVIIFGCGPTGLRTYEELETDCVQEELMC